MRLRKTVLFVLALATAGYGCSKSDSTAGAPADSKNAGAQGATAGKGTDASAKATEERLTKAGWTIESSEDNGENWRSLYLKVSKVKGDDQQTARVWIDAFAEPAEGAPKPVLTLGKGTLIRFGWEPTSDKKPAPDLAPFAKDVAAICPPEKATDNLFNDFKFDDAVKKWGLSDSGSRAGGRLSPSGVVYNHRFLSGEAGTLAIEIVYYEKALAEKEAQLVGTSTLIAVDADDEATAKELYGILGGS
ncbi:hypothetical protein [Polyangium sp. y55x31]|uniref:hypothetical protein n=1 Tax=Polyangium sp. y55x31 TaxID=3042688 RepID=UPI002482D306|nr:hypothetical protein [Polyangium sp. y55x31]MDI1477305.1 hypothetical protein [Polyangium sp. y55x31]